LPLPEVCDLDKGDSGAPHACCFTAESIGGVLAGQHAVPGSRAYAQDSAIQKKFSSLYQAAIKESEVIYYTDGRQDEAQRLSEYWKANFPGVNLRIVPKSSPALIAQIETERAAGQHRVDASHMSQPYVAALWKTEGLLPALQDRELRGGCARTMPMRTAPSTPPTSMCYRPPTYQRVQGQGAAAAKPEGFPRSEMEGQAGAGRSGSVRQHL